MALTLPSRRAGRAVRRPRVVGLGGALRSDSSTEKVLRCALEAAEAAGAETLLLSGQALDLPIYAPGRVARTPAVLRLLTQLREADGLILGSPGYHGGISGLVKNAIDYAEELNGDERPYFEGCAVGCLATGAGWQGAVVTLNALRMTVHALRGWNTPLGVAINSAEPIFESDGRTLLPRLSDQVEIMARQVVGFAQAAAVAQAAVR